MTELRQIAALEFAFCLPFQAGRPDGAVHGAGGAAEGGPFGEVALSGGACGAANADRVKVSGHEVSTGRTFEVTINISP